MMKTVRLVFASLLLSLCVVAQGAAVAVTFTKLVDNDGIPRVMPGFEALSQRPADQIKTWTTGESLHDGLKKYRAILEDGREFSFAYSFDGELIRFKVLELSDEPVIVSIREMDDPFEGPTREIAVLRIIDSEYVFSINMEKTE